MGFNLDNILKRAQELNSENDKKKSADTSLVVDGITYWKPQNGKNTIRILPSIEDGKPFYQEFYMHYSINESKDRVICIYRTFGHKCPICEKCHIMWKSEDTLEKSDAKAMFPRHRIRVNILDTSSEEAINKGPQIYEFGETIFKDIMNHVLDVQEDISDLDNGKEIVLTKTVPPGRPESECKYSMSVRPRAYPVDASVLESAHGLEESLDNILKTPEEMRDILSGKATTVTRSTKALMATPEKLKKAIEESEELTEAVDTSLNPCSEDTTEEVLDTRSTRTSKTSNKSVVKQSNNTDEDNEDDEDDEDDEDVKRPSAVDVGSRIAESNSSSSSGVKSDVLARINALKGKRNNG
jgi:hypothetical protein